MERIQLRRDTAEKWKSVNPILMEGEVGFETDTRLRKIGDGVNRWNDLEYLKAEGIVQESGDSENLTISQKTLSNETFLNRQILTKSDDLDKVTRIGIYVWFNEDVPSNSPMSSGGIMVNHSYFFPSTEGYRLTQQVIDYNNNFYVRYSTTQGLGEWKQLASFGELTNTFYNRIGIGASDDIDAITSMGVYSWPSNNIPINSPFQGYGQMLVIPMELTNTVTRICQYAYNYKGVLYFRYKATTGWDPWEKGLEDSDVLKLAETDTLSYRVSLNDSSDFDNLNHIGIASWISSMSPKNRPFEGGGIVITFPAFKTRYEEFSRTVQLAFGPSNKMSFRYRTTSGWGNWVEVTAINGGGSSSSPTENKIRAFLNKCSIKWEPLGNIPKNSETPSYYQGETTGLPYSSVFVFGNDIHYHRGLSAFYSAIKNPGSILYSEGYGGNTHRGSYYGTVCSTFVCYLCGQKIYRETSEMYETLDKMEYVDVEQLEAGDILITPGHAKVISRVATNEDGEYFISLAEQGGYNMSEKTYNQEDFEKFLKGEDPSDSRVYELGRFPNQSIRVLPKIEYSENVISEYGDRTYFSIGEDVWVYVRSGNVLTILENDTPTQIELSALPTKVVNDTTLYNISSYLYKVGDYQLYVEGDDIYANLVIINTGNVVLDNKTVNLSGYSSNIKPSWWSVIMLRKEETDFPYYPAPDGYVGHQASMCKGDINSDTFDVELKDFVLNSDGYYVRCYYDTKFGLAYKDSNIIMIK